MKILRYSPEKKGEILARTLPTANVTDAVTAIVEDVRARGDAALYEYTARFDKAELSSLAVTRE